MSAYRINWKKGEPFVEAGDIVIVGNKKKIRKIKWPSEEKNKNFSSGFNSINEAIEAEILFIADLFGKSIFAKSGKPDPWILAKCITKIIRLYRRLEKHHLVKHIE